MPDTIIFGRLILIRYSGNSQLMKKLFISILLFLFSHAVWTQVSAGPILGINFSNIAGGKGTNKFKTGFHAGAFLKFNFSDAIAFQPEMLYSTLGFKQQLIFNKSSVLADTSITHALSYIAFPFLLNITVAGNGFLHIGPQIGYIINAKEKGTILTTTNGASFTQTIDTSNVYGFNTTEYALVIGGGYKFDFGLSASLHFTYGFTKLYSNADGHNFVIGISVAYFLGKQEEAGQGLIYKHL